MWLDIKHGVARPTSVRIGSKLPRSRSYKSASPTQPKAQTSPKTPRPRRRHVADAPARNRRPKPRPRSAAPSYMRSTFTTDSALPEAHARRLIPDKPRHRSRYVRQPGHPDEAKYVLQQGAGQNSSHGAPSVPRPRQGFGVRTVNRRIDSGGDGGKKKGRQGVDRSTNG